MAIDFSKISSLLTQLNTTNTVPKTNDYSVNFSEYLMDSMNTNPAKSTAASDLTSALQLNINDPSAVKSYVTQLLGSNGTPNATDFSSILNSSALSNSSTTSANSLGSTGSLSTLASLLGNSTSSTSFDNLLGSNTTASGLSSLLGSGSSTSSLFDNVLSTNKQSSAIDALYSPTKKNSSADAITDGLQSNFMSKQMNLMQTAYSKLQANLEDYKTRNAGNTSAAVQNRIAEMTQNVSTLQTYLQDKLAEKATNDSLLNQLNSNSSLASLQVKK